MQHLPSNVEKVLGHMNEDRLATCIISYTIQNWERKKARHTSVILFMSTQIAPIDEGFITFFVLEKTF